MLWDLPGARAGVRPPGSPACIAGELDRFYGAGLVTVLLSNVTAVCANSRPFIVAPVRSAMFV